MLSEYNLYKPVSKEFVMKKIIWLGLIVGLVLSVSCVSKDPSGAQPKELPGRIEHRGQELFLNGINLAWINYGRDLTMFDEDRYVQALDEIAAAGGNSFRWWLHVNGSSTPEFDGSMVTGMPPESLENLERALDLAWERGLVAVLSLWSFDMLQDQGQMDPDRNKAFLEDPAAVTSYLDNALTPMIEAVGTHPAVVAWEVFNEPEGMLEGSGWTAVRTDMKTIQSFVNKVAGRIHQLAPQAKVTNGTKDFSYLNDKNGNVNYYRDDRLIESGGDPLGILDFYQVHYYPAHMGDGMSPFHRPFSYWSLDKPVLIGEFPANGIIDTGSGFMASAELRSEEAYQWAFNQGYAGAMSWTWTAHEKKFGSLSTAEPGLMSVKFGGRDSVKIDNGNVDWIPVKTGDIPRLLVYINEEPKRGYVDLKNIFSDKEQGNDLVFSVKNNPEPDLVEVVIKDGLVDLIFTPEASGKASIEFSAADETGNTTVAVLELVVVDPDRGNIALFKPVTSKTVEEQHQPELLNDGLTTTRYSSLYEDDQWIEIDLEGEFEVKQMNLLWEAAYGKVYELLASKDGENWTLVASEESGKEGSNNYTFTPIEARYIRLNLLERGTDWGFSLYEVEVIGERIK